MLTNKKNVTYIVVPRKNPMHKEEEPKFYMKAHATEYIGVTEISKRIEKGRNHRVNPIVDHHSINSIDKSQRNQCSHHLFKVIYSLLVSSAAITGFSTGIS